MKDAKDELETNASMFEFSIAESVREKMISVATDHVNSFDEFISEFHARHDSYTMSSGLRHILGYFAVLCEEWEAEHPTSRITALSSSEAAKEFIEKFSDTIFRLPAEDNAPWTAKLIDEAKREFSDFIEDFNEFEKTRASRTDISFNLADSPLTTAKVQLLGSNASLSSLKGEGGRLFSVSEMPIFHSPPDVISSQEKLVPTALGLPESRRNTQPDPLNSGRDNPLFDGTQDLPPLPASSAAVPVAPEDTIRSSTNSPASPPASPSTDTMEQQYTSDSMLEARSVISNFVACLPFAKPMKAIPASSWSNFLSENLYEQEKAHAIELRDAAKLVQLYFQDHKSPQYGLITLAEMEVGQQLREYEQFLTADDTMGEMEYTTTSEDSDILYPRGGNTMKSLFAVRGGGDGGYQDWAMADLLRYREHHKELTDAEPKIYQNVDFYRGAVPHPSYKDFIDDFHNVEKYRDQSAATTTDSYWFGCYRRLEAEHCFIQHLFPIQEGRGMSHNSQRLQKHEIDTMRLDPVIQERILRSFETICDFFGIHVERNPTEELGLFPDKVVTLLRSNHYEDEFDNLNASSHNYLRITRICKFLGDVGLEQCAEALVDFFIQECFEVDEDDLWLNNLRSSLEKYWVETIRADDVRARFKERITRGKEMIVERKQKKITSEAKDEE